MEQTLVLVKPDGVKRGLSGEIVTRFERAGLKIVGMKMIRVDADIVRKHYPEREGFLEALGKKTLETYAKYGKDPNEEMGTMDPREIGKMVNAWNMEFLSSGPVVAIVLEGNHAVENVRRIVGSTIPTISQPGTIRGDYSVDSPALANKRKRSLRNVVHASGNAEEAKYEIQLWFKQNELHSYKRADEGAMFE
ncbi:MAG: nucleoside-diphosphate kinase [Candidatus Liptonbacteria bacterium]|nr:nucleoside-diphosphate kinase [Candidatus Liptonbacteria bacterium]